ncbi:hypothetical protein A9Q89_07250 [Gammaproteobacteria bacterium 53_120_T64]|mgnify:CR=1 FL=1|nr:hypothetical protein A9Q89_07250 [Gammaproteobacteria bacterium 53_120_T64]
MFRLYALTLYLCLSGCTHWPQGGHGGMAERERGRHAPLLADQPLGPRQSLRIDLDLAGRHLDILVLRGARTCFPASTLLARQLEQRAARELEGDLVFDAALDLLELRHDLSAIENKLTSIDGATCRPQTATASTRAQLDIRESKAILARQQRQNLATSKPLLALNHDNQFAFNSSQLNPKYQQHLAGLVLWLTKQPQYQLFITGHSDVLGSESYNQALSTARAQAVADYLVSLGLSNSHLKVWGVAAAQPLFAGRAPAIRLVNRRVSIELTFEPKRLPGGGK